MRVEDEFGNVVAGATVQFSASGTSTVSAASVGTDINGLASVDWTLGGTAGAYTLTAAVGELSVVFTATAEAVPATAPTLTGLTPGNGQISVAFTAPADTGGSAITNYQYQLDGGDWVAFAPAVTAGPAVISGLTNGQSYSVSLRAVTAAGAGASSNALSTTPVTVPGAPTNVTVVRGDGQVTVSWEAPTETGGSDITSYTVTGSPGGVCTVGAAVTECTITGLTNGTVYSFTVVATNDVGDSLASEASPAVTPATVPAPPTGVTAAAGNKQATISWAVPTDNGGSVITGYTVTASPGGETCTTTDAITCTMTGLTNGTAYTFTVVATNEVGDSPASEASAAVTPSNELFLDRFEVIHAARSKGTDELIFSVKLMALH